jgi:cytochrome c-type biogenesis protein CcmH
MRLSRLIVLLALATGYVAGQSPEQKSRIAKLESSLLAPCCYSEPVATHRSEVSLAMRAEIEKMVAEGKSDREILDLYKARYGLRILVEPEGARWWWMHVVPVVVTLLGLLLVIYLIRRMLRPIPASSQ